MSENQFFDKNVKYVCFYSGQINKVGKWEYIKVNTSKNNLVQSRNFKINYYNFFSNEKTVYIDCNRLMKRNFVDNCKRIFDRSDFAVLKHPIRKSFLDELIDWYLISVIKQKDFKSIINLFEQYNYDYNAHLCPHLYCIWRSDNISNRDFSKQWWKNYNIFKLRDQLLFSLTLQQKLQTPLIIEKDNFTNKQNHLKTYQKNKKKIKNIFKIIQSIRSLTPKNLSFSLDTLKWRNIKNI
tara:strand:- start:1879 stop:2592 length:714 start_codon:yes stop_codon:yes gene_type:complete